jgi:hypothetical protein
MLTGLSIGIFQAVALRKLISEPVVWAVAYAGGLLAGIIMVLLISSVAFASADFIIEALYTVELWDVVYYRDMILTMSNLLALPIWLALVIGLPTGNILHKNFGTPKTG